MKLGVRAHDFGRMTPDRLAGAVAAAGFETVQLALTKAILGIERFEEVRLSHLEAVRDGFAKHSVEISVLGCYVEPSLPDREERLRHVANFCRGLSHAKELGAAVAGTETTSFPPTPEMESQREARYQDLKDSVLRMAEEAERLGVDIGIEPVADHTLHSAELTRRLLNEVDSRRLRIIFDPVNLILSHTAHRQQDIYREFLQRLGKEIVAVHVKDVIFQGEEKIWRPIGEGTVPYEELFSWLKEHRSGVPVLREHAKPESRAQDLAEMRRLAGR